MKQNITLRLDKELIKRAKIRSAQQETSITGLLSEYMEKLVRQEDDYQTDQKKALELLDVGYSLGQKRITRRDTLHER